MRDSQKKTRYPIRTLRYWWVICAIQEELKKRGITAPTIADVGCDRGILKRIVPEIKDSKWMAFDMAPNLEFNKKDMAIAKYDELHGCDLDEGIPIPDNSADIVVCIHVLEHVPRPEFTMSELSRILRPGGMMLIGFPIHPKPLAHIREKQFAKQFAAGTRQRGQHCHAFWPSRSRKLAEDAGLEVEFMAGSHMLRWSGSPLENLASWIRLNQLWGALFPGFAGELCMQLRKPAE